MKRLLILLTIFFSCTPFVVNAAIVCGSADTAPTLNSAQALNSGAGSPWMDAQPFTPSQDCVPSNATFYFSRNSSGIGNVMAAVWSDSAGAPNAPLATSSSLALTSFAIYPSNTQGTVTFSAAPTLHSGTQYWFIVARDNNTGQGIAWGSASAPYGDFYVVGTGWVTANTPYTPMQMNFVLNGTIPSVVVPLFQTIYGWW